MEAHERVSRGGQQAGVGQRRGKERVWKDDVRRRRGGTEDPFGGVEIRRLAQGGHEPAGDGSGSASGGVQHGAFFDLRDLALARFLQPRSKGIVAGTGGIGFVGVIVRGDGFGGGKIGRPNSAGCR